MASVCSAVREAFPGCATYVPCMPYASRFCRRSPGAIAADLLDEIDVLMSERDYARLVFIGHSMSSLIARKVVVLAHGEHEEAPFESEVKRHAQPKPWAERIDRLILLAGISRGWSTTAAHNWLTGTLWALASLVGDIVFLGNVTILGIRLGAPFVVQTRLQWLELTRRRQRPIVTVQLLGSRDDTVSPDDTIDFAIDLANRSFVLIDLPNTDHLQAVEMEGDKAARRRRRRLIAALLSSPEELEEMGYGVPACVATNGAPPVAESDVTDVVFVIHGIRDKGFWTQKIARRVMEEAANDRKEKRVVRSMTLSYGYLAMLPFVLPWVRRDKVRWLMDRYADCRAFYPNAKFSYVGHSNGTYLAARALRDYPAARFRRIVFAGSVVRSDYDWQSVITGARRQVDEVMNYVASADWVVAIFPNGFSRFRIVDLGGAGHHGFNQLVSVAEECPAGARITSVMIGQRPSHQIDFVSGNHGAGIRESQWDEIARFIVHGTPPSANDRDYVAKQTRWVVRAGSLPPLALLLLALAAGIFLFGLAYILASAVELLAPSGLGQEATKVLGWAISALITFLLVRVILTRF